MEIIFQLDRMIISSYKSYIFLIPNKTYYFERLLPTIRGSLSLESSGFGAVLGRREGRSVNRNSYRFCIFCLFFLALNK